MRHIQYVLRSIRAERGTGAAVKCLILIVFEISLRPLTAGQESRFDRRRGVQTRRDGGNTPTALYDSASLVRARYPDALPYAPTPTRQFLRILRTLPVEDFAAFTFIDLGCGMGRALLLAADSGFGRVVGVEVDDELVQAARRNIAVHTRAHAQHVDTFEVLRQDAADYHVPHRPAVVFMFNPFGESTLSKVLDNLVASIGQTPRRLFVVYFNAVHQGLLDQTPWLRRISRTPRWAVYEAVIDGH
jgi:SAM-dependent methyltransferase